jgi:hypothetical protein
MQRQKAFSSEESGDGEFRATTHGLFWEDATNLLHVAVSQRLFL